MFFIVYEIDNISESGCCLNMGKKPNVKAKERKAERKAMEMKMNSGVYSVKKANAQTDPLEPLPSFSKFERNGVDLVLEARKAGSLDTSTKDWIFDLTERNMKEMYTKVSTLTTIAQHNILYLL